MKIRLLLVLAPVLIAIAPAVTLAQDNGSHKLNDPTGAWLIRNSEGVFILTVFHKGGTLTGDVQGESAFIPGAEPPSDVIITPESGVWQKTGGKTFAATFLTIEYQVQANLNAPVFQFDKVQFTGVLSESGNQIELTARVTIFNPDGTQKGDSFSDKANGIRIPLEILPNTSNTLPLPPVPTAPAP